MHVVHYNSKYDTFEDAVNKTNGLHVLAFLFEVTHACGSMQIVFLL